MATLSRRRRAPTADDVPPLLPAPSDNAGSPDAAGPEPAPAVEPTPAAKPRRPRAKAAAAASPAGPANAPKPGRRASTAKAPSAEAPSTPATPARSRRAAAATSDEAAAPAATAATTATATMAATTPAVADDAAAPPPAKARARPPGRRSASPKTPPPSAVVLDDLVVPAALAEARPADGSTSDGPPPDQTPQAPTPREPRDDRSRAPGDGAQDRGPAGADRATADDAVADGITEAAARPDPATSLANDHDIESDPLPAAPAATAGRAPAAPVRRRHSEVRLHAGPPCEVQWLAGSDCPTELQQALVRLGAGDGVLREADSLSAALQLAEQVGHTVVVEDAAWAHLAALGDLHRRVDHLAGQYPAGPLGPAWAEAPGEPAQPRLLPRPCQLEAALFAACIGACMLADEPALDPVRELGLAWQLVRRHFGAPAVSVYAPPARQAEWRAALAAPVPEAGADAADVADAAKANAATVHCLAGPAAPEAPALTSTSTPTPTPPTEVCILDLRDGLGDPQAWPEAVLAAPWLWLLAPADALREPAGDALAWLQRLDRLQAGVVADWQARGQPEALAPLLLRRRWPDVADQWPAWHVQRQACGWPDAAAAEQAAALDALRTRLQRWQRSAFLSDTEQLALQRLVHAEQRAARQAAAAALPALLQAALARGEQRLVVFSEAGAELPSLAQQLQALGLPVLTWAGSAGPTAHAAVADVPKAAVAEDAAGAAGATEAAETAGTAKDVKNADDDEGVEAPPATAEAVLRSFRDATGPCVLLVADAPACNAHRITCHPHRPAVIHLDSPWDAAVLAHRLARLRFPRGFREVPVWHLQPDGSLASRRDARRGATPDVAMPATATTAPGLRRGAALAAWLDDLMACLALPAPTP